MTRHDPTTSSPTGELRMEPLPLIRAFALLVATVIGLYVCYLLVLPFLAALAISVLTTPAYRYLESRLTNASLAATIFVILLAPLVSWRSGEREFMQRGRANFRTPDIAGF